MLSEVDPATTDAERAEWDVPPLAEARRRAADIPLAAPPGSPRVLLEAKLPELHVQLVDMRPPKVVERLSRSARPEPLGRDETVRWMPGYLPEGVTVMKFGGAYAATRGGEPLLTWVQAPVRPRLPVMLIVDPASGTPRLHVREQEGRQVLVVEGAAFVAWAPTGWTLVLTPAGPGAAWMVAGTLPVKELARVLLSLPSQPS